MWTLSHWREARKHKILDILSLKLDMLLKQNWEERGGVATEERKGIASKRHAHTTNFDNFPPFNILFY